MLNILSHEGMQIKTTHSYSPSSDGYHEESRSPQRTETSAGLGCGERGTLTYCYWECKLAQSLCKWVLIFLQKLEIELPYDLAIAPPGRNPSQQTAKLLWASVLVPLLLEIPRNGVRVPQQVSGKRERVCIARAVTRLPRRMESGHLQENGWAEIITRVKQSTPACSGWCVFSFLWNLRKKTGKGLGSGDDRATRW